MPAAAMKKPVATDNSRQALASAIAAHRQAAAALAVHQSAIHRATEAIGEIEREIHTAAAVQVAESTTVTMRATRDQRTELDDRLILARAELERLHGQLKEKELHTAFSADAVIVERNSLLAPVAAAVLARIKAARIEMLKDRVLLAALIGDDAPDPPPPAGDPRSFFQVREAEAARRRAFGAVRAEAARAAADLTVGPAVFTLEEGNLVMQVVTEWKRRLAELLKDANAKLPGEV